MVNQLEKLRELIRSRAYRKVDGVQLASGQSSNHYFDLKKVSLHASSLKCLSQCLFADLKKRDPELTWVAGVSVGGDPVVTGIILESLENAEDWQALLVRKKPKSHGMSQGRAVEGPHAEELKAGWLIEDVVSTGGSSLEAAQMMRDEGYKLSGVLCIVDREMGGLDKLREALGVPCEALFRASEILA